MATPTPPAGVTAYAAKLTGGPDSLPDLELPVSAFSASIRNASPSYLSITVPSVNYAADIAARPNGDIIVTHYKRDASGVVIAVAIATVNYGGLRLDEGARNKSLTLSGNKQTTYSTPKTVVLTGGVTYRSTTNGTRRLRTVIIPELLPGDTVEYLATSIIVDSLSIYASPGLEQMEIIEEVAPAIPAGAILDEAGAAITDEAGAAITDET